MSTQLAVQPSQILDLRSVGQDTPFAIEAHQPVTMTVMDVIKWVAPEASPQDALKFLLVCRNARLNPLLGEIFLLPMGGKFQTVIPKAGYLKRAQEHHLYDGHASGVTVWFKGEFHDFDGTIRPPVDGCAVVGGWAKVWRKGVERPCYKRVSLDEYRKNTPPWRDIPATMIAKVALVAALRESFSLSDSYDESEIDHELPSAPKVEVVATPFLPPRGEVAREAEQPVVAEAVADTVIDATTEEVEPVRNYRTDDTIGYVRPDLYHHLMCLVNETKITEDEYDAMMAKRNVRCITQLTVAQAEELAIKLESLIRESEADQVFGPGEAEAALPGQPKAEDLVLPDVTRNG